MNDRLVVESLSVAYGGVRAVQGVDLTVGAGQVVGLIGPNGAGKTTFIDAVTGFTPCRGRVVLDDRDLTGLPPHRRARLGLARTFQSVELFDDLTIAENVAVPVERPTWRGTVRDLVRPRAAATDGAVGEALALLGLEHLADRQPNDLSHGQRRLVACARAIVGHPALVCMDEPAAGLDTTESRVLGGHLRTIVAAGPSILLVDHDMSMVLEVCDWVYVLQFGEVIAAGSPDDIRRHPAVVAAYLGRSAEGGAA